MFNNNKLGWKIFGLIFSIFLIWGGFSGELVLRGTDSSTALVVVGFLFLIWDIYALATHKKQAEAEVKAEANAAPLPDELKLENNAPQEQNKLNDAMIRQEAVLPSAPEKHNGLQWFFKVFRHYADFSGRARRREYWYFFLFNMIFSFALSYILVFAFVLANQGNFDVRASWMVSLSYLAVFMLPGMAVFVRRLHDTGKSGWMFLVGFIPVVGSIWLLVLMFTDSEPGDNKYGPNPKSSPETFSDQAKVKNAGVTLIVAASAGIMLKIATFALYMTNSAGLNYYWAIFGFIINALLLTAGICLLSEKQIYGIPKKQRSMLILLVAVSISVLMGIWGITSNIQHTIGWQVIVNSIVYIVMDLSVALFAAIVFFSPLNKSHIRNTSIAVIVFAGFTLLYGVYSSMGAYWGYDWLVAVNLLNTFYVLVPVAYILLACTFLSINNQSVPFSVPVPAPEAPEKGKSTVFGGSARPYCILEHRTGSRYHETGEKQKIVIDHAEIGRDSNCAVRYDEKFETVSRRHAAIIRNGNDWKLVAMSKTNPTFVNGKMVQGEWYLQHGDEIQCAVNGPKLVFKVYPPIT